MPLNAYRQKRDFSRTTEPAGRRTRGATKHTRQFVIQQHAARRLHYDLRLELGGVLKSWAVPKDFPLNQGEKVLAMHVEDHPLEYGSFEGVIPPGNYGAGSVMLWDRGAYEPLDPAPARALEKGKLAFTLHGEKLKGQWTLVRMKGRAEAGKDPWLLIKTGEDARAPAQKTATRSVASRRTMKQIAAAADRIWKSNSPAPRATARAKPRPVRADKKLPASKPRFVSPMKALSRPSLPRGADWIYELKFDGIRGMAVKEGATVKISSRRPRDLSHQYPELVAALKQLPARQAVLDGEIVALDDAGRSSFQLLQNLQRDGAHSAPIRYYLFDLLQLDGRNLQALPLEARKERLRDLLAGVGEPLRFSDALPGEPDRLWQEIQKRGLEGIVAKRRDSAYEPDRRSGAWVKVKSLRQQEFVIGGYTQPGGSRPYFGAVLAGYYEQGKLLFAARVGSGFDTQTLRELFQRFQALRQEDCPFANLPAPRRGRWGEGLTRAEMKRCVWLRPELVCQVRYLEWTRDGGLRHPVFLGMREDKQPGDIGREPVAAED